MKVKKLIDRRGFGKNKSPAEKRGKTAESKTVKIADAANGKSVTFVDAAKAPTEHATSISTTARQSSSERVNSRWVTPISKPEKAVSKNPMRRIPIEEVGE